MKVGGVQKSLYNLLWTIHREYEITLLLFHRTGAYIDQLPPDVKVISCKSLFRYLGVSQSECKAKLSDRIKRGFLATVSRVFGKRYAIRMMLATQPMLPDSYDAAIAYLHNGNPKSFYGGVQEFVLQRINAKRKIAFLHCDWRNCGANHPYNIKLIEQFDQIAACSDGCRLAFESVLGYLKDKCVTVRNCHRIEEIRAMAEKEPVLYDKRIHNVLVVSRLSHEKGVERAIQAAAHVLQKGIPVHLHIVGGGAMSGKLKELAAELEIEPSVSFYGEQSNPYRFMKNAGLFLLTSYHEAAPMVIEEAAIIGLPVLTVQTTSSTDMVVRRGIGWECANSQDAINRALELVLSDSDALQATAQRLQCGSPGLNNTEAVRSFAKLIR